MVECEFSKLKKDIEQEFINSGRVAVGVSLLENIEKEDCCGKIFIFDWAFVFAKKIMCKNVTFELDDAGVISYIWFIKNMGFDEEL